ncbi:hypothetical protein CDV31_001499 [Fusarium ambrosium]|uniref:Uncharacterized protein n=1 Tax=Fusarium ambrosium TaxID=131363 RepID=A0A428UZB9_9HYPO|nr:hypothetical protein CDV31_001499 [Fusarium ambrosium]
MKLSALTILAITTGILAAPVADPVAVASYGYEAPKNSYGSKEVNYGHKDEKKYTHVKKPEHHNYKAPEKKPVYKAPAKKPEHNTYKAPEKKPTSYGY